MARMTRAPSRLPRTHREVERGQQIWEMHIVQGMTQRQVAEHFGVSQQLVSQIVSAIRKDLGERGRKERAESIVDQLEEAIALAYSRYRDGDRQEGKNYRAFVERYCKLLGLDAPDRLVVGGPNQISYIIEGDEDVIRAIAGDEVHTAEVVSEDGVTRHRIVPGEVIR
jgi:predicted transcriptional regulator